MQDFWTDLLAIVGASLFIAALTIGFLLLNPGAHRRRRRRRHSRRPRIDLFDQGQATRLRHDA